MATLMDAIRMALGVQEKQDPEVSTSHASLLVALGESTSPAAAAAITLADPRVRVEEKSHVVGQLYELTLDNTANTKHRQEARELLKKGGQGIFVNLMMEPTNWAEPQIFIKNKKKGKAEVVDSGGEVRKVQRAELDTNITAQGQALASSDGAIAMREKLRAIGMMVNSPAGLNLGNIDDALAIYRGIQQNHGDILSELHEFDQALKISFSLDITKTQQHKDFLDHAIDLNVHETFNLLQGFQQVEEALCATAKQGVMQGIKPKPSNTIQAQQTVVSHAVTAPSVVMENVENKVNELSDLVKVMEMAEKPMWEVPAGQGQEAATRYDQVENWLYSKNLMELSKEQLLGRVNQLHQDITDYGDDYPRSRALSASLDDISKGLQNSAIHDLNDLPQALESSQVTLRSSIISFIANECEQVLADPSSSALIDSQRNFPVAEYARWIKREASEETGLARKLDILSEKKKVLSCDPDYLRLQFAAAEQRQDLQAMNALALKFQSVVVRAEKDEDDNAIKKISGIRDRILCSLAPEGMSSSKAVENYDPLESMPRKDVVEVLGEDGARDLYGAVCGLEYTTSRLSNDARSSAPSVNALELCDRARDVESTSSKQQYQSPSPSPD